MEEKTSILSITQKDLEDPNLYRLNQALTAISSQISAIRDNGRFTGVLQADSITAKLFSEPPHPNDVVPWGTIKRLLSPASIRQAFITNNWLGTPVRPVTGVDIPANLAGIIQAIVDTHDNRISSYYASGYDIGSLYYETDRTSLYQVQNVSGSKAWVWISGLMIDVLADQPTDLTTNDNGFNFLATDAATAYSYRWDGSAWDVIDLFAENGSLYKYDNSLNSSLVFGRARGSAASPSNAASADVIADILFKARRNGSFVDAASIAVEIESAPSSTTAAGAFTIKTVDSTGSALTARWQINSDGNILPFADDSYDIGSGSLGVGKLWTNDINIKQGGSSGDVLTNDGSDNGVWSAASSGSANNYLSANASATDTLTTSYADTSGCSLSLNEDGYWLVCGNFLFVKGTSDDECAGRLDYDGTAQTGICGVGFSTASSITAMASRQWVVQVSGQPKTVKLQAKKNSGAGTSQSVITNTNIIAVFLKP